MQNKWGWGQNSFITHQLFKLWKKIAPAPTPMRWY